MVHSKIVKASISPQFFLLNVVIFQFPHKSIIFIIPKKEDFPLKHQKSKHTEGKKD